MRASSDSPPAAAAKAIDDEIRVGLETGETKTQPLPVETSLPYGGPSGQTN